MNINAQEFMFLNRMRNNEGVNEGVNEGINEGVNGGVSQGATNVMHNTTRGFALRDNQPMPAENPNMKALMFQGMKNLMENPQLAGDVKAFNNMSVQPETENNDMPKEYVAPYSSNLAFQGKGNFITKIGSKVKQKAATGMAALMLGGAAIIPTLQSCEKIDLDQHMQEETSITIDYEALTTLLAQMQSEIAQLRKENNEANKAMLEALTTLINLTQQLLDKATSQEKILNELNQKQQQILNALVANGYTLEEAKKLLNDILNSDMSIAEQLKAITDLLNSIDQKLDKVIEDLGKIYENDQDIKKALDQINKGIQAGNIQQATTNRFLQSLLILAQKCSAELKSQIGELIKKLGEISEKQDLTNEQLEELNTTSSKTQELIEKYGNKGEQYAKALYQAICALGFDMNVKFSKLIEEVIKNGDKIDTTNQLLEQNNVLAQQNKVLARKIFRYLTTFGLNMSTQLNQILIAINTGNQTSAALQSALDRILDAIEQMDANQQERANKILDAIANIEVQGGTVDLSTVEEMLADLLTETRANGNILTDIDAKLDVANITITAIKEKMETEYGKNDIRYTNMMNLLNALKGKIDNFDDATLLEKLDLITSNQDKIMDLIKNHQVTIDVTGKVTCECNCSSCNGGNNEGILEDLENVLQ